MVDSLLLETSCMPLGMRVRPRLKDGRVGQLQDCGHGLLGQRKHRPQPLGEQAWLHAGEDGVAHQRHGKNARACLLDSMNGHVLH
jgi:hypothetical protein